MDDDLPRTVDLGAAARGPVCESARAAAYLLSPAAPLPEGTEVTFLLPTSARFAYAPRAPGPAEAREITPDPTLRGNAFRAVHKSARALAAMLSIANGRRMESGPESERTFVFLRGNGLVFLENGDAMHVGPGTLALVPAGEPAAVWAQGPEDLLAVVLQPAGAPVGRRTLAGEIAKRRAQPE